MLKKTNWKKILVGEFTLKRLVVSLLEIYILLAIIVYFWADSMIFLPPSSSYQDNAAIIKLNSGNKTISAIYLPNDQAEFTILYSHGNAEDLGHIQPWLIQLQQAGFAVLAYDYRSYGTSQGRASEKNSYLDIEAAYKYLVNQKNADPNKIILYGRSIGSAISINLAQKHPVAGLILESSFTSAFRVITPIPLLPFDKFNNLKKLPHIHFPIMYIHGTNDQIVPPSHTKQLILTTPKVTSYLWVEGAGHNDLYVNNSQLITQNISTFTKEIN